MASPTPVLLAITAVLMCTADASSRKILQAPAPAPVCAVPLQANTTLLGYTFNSNIAGYPQMSLDVVDMASLLDQSPPDFSGALALFNAGRNSLRSNCAVRTFRSWATANNSADPFWGFYESYFGSPPFLSTMYDQVFNGTAPFADPAARVQGLKAMSRSTIQFCYMMHEVDAAWTRAIAGASNPVSGGAHNADEADGIWAGVGTPTAGSLNNLANEVGTAAGTVTNGESRAGAQAIADLGAMQTAATKNDTATSAAARADLIKQAVIIHTQATLMYAAKLAAGADVVAHQAAAFSYFRTILPLVANVSADAASAVVAAINLGSAPDAAAVTKIQAALAPVYQAYQISSADMGLFATPTAVDLAGAVASQSSVDGAHVAGNAIDASSASYAATRRSIKPWWALKLPQEQYITAVTLSPPEGVTVPRDVQVKVGGKAPSKGGSPQDRNTRCAFKPGALASAGGSVTLTCARPSKGTWVTVQAITSRGIQALSLQGVKLMGFAA